MDRKRPCSDCRDGTDERRGRDHQTGSQAGRRGGGDIRSTDARTRRAAERVLYRTGGSGSAGDGSDGGEGDVYSTGRGRFGAPGGNNSDPGGGQRAEADTHHGAGEGEL